MIVVQTLYKMKKKRGMFMENEQSVVLTNWKRNYLFFLSGQFLSGITSMVVQYAIIWYLTRETGSATILSFATLLGMIPMVLLSPFVGPLVDRWDKKALLIVTDIIVAIFALILCVRSHKHSKCQRSSRLCRQSFHLLT